MLSRTATLGCLLIVTSLVACSSPAPTSELSSGPAARVSPVADDPAAWGPYQVGVRELEVPARHHPGNPLETLIWYPAELDAESTPYVYLNDETMGALSGTAVEDAALAGTDRFPAVVFSHGNGGLSYQSIFLTEHLASHGYVVISCEHPGNSMFNYHPSTFITGLITRPKDISALIDYLEGMNDDTSDPLNNRIDLDHIGMTGHSFGGYTTLAISGAQLNVAPAKARCKQTKDPESCLLVQTLKEFDLNTNMIDLSDSRVIAAAPLAPWSWEPFHAEGLSYLNLPLQVHGGGLDDTCPMERQIEPVYQYAQPPKSMLELYAAGHYTYSDICLLDPTYDECNEPFIDIDYAHTLINSWVTSLFKVYLSEDASYETYLSADYAAQYSADLAWSVTAE